MVIITCKQSTPGFDQCVRCLLRPGSDPDKDDSGATLNVLERCVADCDRASLIDQKAPTKCYISANFLF